MVVASPFLEGTSITDSTTAPVPDTSSPPTRIRVFISEIPDDCPTTGCLDQSLVQIRTNKGAYAAWDGEGSNPEVITAGFNFIAVSPTRRPSWPLLLGSCPEAERSPTSTSCPASTSILASTPPPTPIDPHANPTNQTSL